MNLKRAENSNYLFFLIKIIFILIFYQEVFVINIGGSFKSYELISIYLMFIYLFVDKEKRIYGFYSIILFIFFVISPLLGNISNLFNTTKSQYYLVFPEAVNRIRFNIWISPILIYVYYVFNWVVINYIIGSMKVYEFRVNLLKSFVISGSLVALYALYGYYFVSQGFPDLIPKILDYRNSTPLTQIRPAGFSIEPGTYVLMLSWVILYLIYLPNLFRKGIRALLLVVNIWVLILTQSSAMLAFILPIVLVLLLFSGFRTRIWTILTFIPLVIMGGIILTRLNLVDPLYYVFVVKIQNFISIQYPKRIFDSGQIRNLTSRLGLSLFKRYPFFGVGGGNSYYYLWKEDISLHNPVLNYDMAPQNAHSEILAELGLFGYIFFIFSFFVLFNQIRRRLSKMDPFYKIGIIGLIMTFGMLFSIYPIYSLYIWINLALIANYLFHQSRELTYE